MSSYVGYLWLRGLRGADLNSSEFHVLVMASTWADGKTGGDIHPGLSKLVNATGLSRSTVIRALNTLVARGYLEKVTKGGIVSGRRIATTYRVVIDRPATPAVSEGQLVPPTPPVSPTPLVAPAIHPGVTSDTPSTHLSLTTSEEGNELQENEFDEPPLCEQCGDEIDGPGKCAGCAEPLEPLEEVFATLDPRYDQPILRTRAQNDLLKGWSIEEVREELVHRADAEVSA